MSFGIKSTKRLLRAFRRSDEGGATVEFVIVFLPFMLLTISAFELGLLMTRHVMLERGLDMAVREVRLNTGTALTEDDFRAMICNSAGIIADCTSQLRLEMISVDLTDDDSVNASAIPRDASCIDASDPFQPSRNFTNGASNEMMIVRACARVKPMLPEIALGYFLSRMDGGYYRLVSTSAFVMEPT